MSLKTRDPSEGFLTEEEYAQHSVRAELYQRSDVDVVGSKVDTRLDALARIRKDFDAAGAYLRKLFTEYDKAQKDATGVGITLAFDMDAPLQAAYNAWLTENGKRAEGPGEAPIPVIHEDNA